MKELPPGLRRYLWVLYLAGLVLIGRQLWLFAVRPWPMAMIGGAAVFALTAYAGERTQLQVSGAVSQTLATAVHVAVILLYPPPFPLLVTLLGALVQQILHARLPLYKRAFNIFHPVLTVGLTSVLFALVNAPGTVLRPGHIVAAAPALAFLIGLYYLLDVGIMLGVLALAQRQPPWRIWWQLYRRTLLPELATSTIGILAAVAWWFDHALLALFVLPVVSLGVAFRAIAAEDRANALRRRGEQLEAVLSAGQHLRLHHSPADLLQPVAEAARTVTGATVVAAYLCDAADPTTLQRVVLAPPGAINMAPASLSAPARGGGIQHLDTLEGDTEERLLLVPLEQDGLGVTGLLRLAGVPGELADGDRDTLAILATQATIALQNAHLHERAVAQASEDGLTGLLNHRVFQMRLEDEINRARHSGRGLALLMIDLDNFGAINNTYGHQAGDATLITIAGILRESIRAADVAARYGGDEFAVVLPETEMDEALRIAERIRAGIATCTIMEGHALIRVGASLGVAACPYHAGGREELVRAADQAAYAAKHAGKGRVGRPEHAVLPLDRDPAVLAAQLEHANLATVEALAAAVDAKDPYTRGHSQRVSAYAAALATALGLSMADIARVRLAGLLHDVGKIGIPDAILAKTEALSDDEIAVIRQHPVIGERMLVGVPFLRDILPAVRHHHERWDGTGYPDGLAGAAIPRDAAILMVADSFDAMMTSRTYRSSLPLAEARRRLREGSGAQFDPRVIAICEKALVDGSITPQLSDGALLVLHKQLERAG